MYNNSPYLDIPNDLLSKYSLDGKIPIIHSFRDDSKILHSEWSDTFIKQFIDSYTPYNIINNLEGISTYGHEVCESLLSTFIKYNVKNKKVAVVGSETPWIEAILINLGNIVTTIEYNVPKINSEYLKVEDYFDYFEKNTNDFDIIVTFSSIEHSGLGRYGDPLDPEGDIKTMESIYNNLKYNGLLIWGAPVGNDALVWNLHRIYGKTRLPLIFNKFNEIEWVGNNKDELLNIPVCNFIQPIVILEKI